MSSSKDQENTFARRPTWAEIDLNNLAANFKRVRQMVTPVARVMAVVKANAYGHGAVAGSRIKARIGLASHFPKRELNCAPLESRNRCSVLQASGPVRLRRVFNTS